MQLISPSLLKRKTGDIKPYSLFDTASLPRGVHSTPATIAPRSLALSAVIQPSAGDAPPLGAARSVAWFSSIGSFGRRGVLH
jgi:hypothetical protein